MPIMFLFKEVVLKHTCCVMRFMGVLQLPWIRRTIFTYPFKLETWIWMGPEDSHANIMCPNLLLMIMCAWYVCVPRRICATICFANHWPSFLFLSVLWCFLFIKFGTASFIGQHLKKLEIFNKRMDSQDHPILLHTWTSNFFIVFASLPNCRRAPGLHMVS